MAVGDWSAATLATYGDVLNRYSRAYDLTGETVTGNQQAVITNYLAKAKEHLGRLLNASLRERWVDMDLDVTADIRDYIENPEVFKEAVVARALAFMFEDNAFEEGDYHDKRRIDYLKEFESEYRLGLSLVDFDADASGDIDEVEKTGGIGGYRFMRA